MTAPPALPAAGCGERPVEPRPAESTAEIHVNNDSRPGADIGLAVVLIAISLLTIYGTLELPAGSFEPYP